MKYDPKDYPVLGLCSGIEGFELAAESLGLPVVATAEIDEDANTVAFLNSGRHPFGDNRLLKARFEKYLSQPPESGEAAETYRATITEILSTISPFRQGGPDLYTGFKLLPTAATYPGDANLCMSLAESIYTAMLAKPHLFATEFFREHFESAARENMRCALVPGQKP